MAGIYARAVTSLMGEQDSQYNAARTQIAALQREDRATQLECAQRPSQLWIVDKLR